MVVLQQVLCEFLYHFMTGRSLSDDFYNFQSLVKKKTGRAGKRHVRHV